MQNSDSFGINCFPFTIKNILLFLFIGAGIGLVLGMPLWILQGAAIQTALNLLVILFLIVFSIWLALSIVRTLVRTAHSHVRFGIPLVLLLFVSADVVFRFHPQMDAIPRTGLEESTALEFVRLCIPDFRQTVLLAPWLLLYTAFIGWIVGRMRVVQNVRIPYTRKIFHFFIFTLAAVLQPAFGLSSVVLFGFVAGLAISYAALRGPGFPFYEAIARQTDAPHSTFFVTVPLLSTAVGGVVANLISIRFAPIGYLITGWGDAIAEPVGSRWGRHWYKVPGLDGIHVTRSLEGSLSILLVGTAVSYFWCLLTGMPPSLAFKTALLCAVIGTVVEGISNHGLDNFTIQAAVTAAAAWVVR